MGCNRLLLLQGFVVSLPAGKDGLGVAAHPGPAHSLMVSASLQGETEVPLNQ